MKRRAVALSMLTGLAVLAPAVAAAKPSPSAQARTVRTAWLREVAHRAKVNRRTTFANLPRAVWFTRVQRLERRYGFRVVEARILRPVQDAPLLIVRTNRPPGAFSRDVPAIQRSLDPKLPTGDDRTGWAYEGFYLEARDKHGAPFLAVFNYWRGPHKGGGQWARDTSLYPYGTLGGPYRP